MCMHCMRVFVRPSAGKSLGVYVLHTSPATGGVCGILSSVCVNMCDFFVCFFYCRFDFVSGESPGKKKKRAREINK